MTVIPTSHDPQRLVSDDREWDRCQCQAMGFVQCLSIRVTNTGGNDASYSGRNWIYGNMIPTRYSQIMPPNSKSCYVSGSNPNGNGATTASSRHNGGVNLCLADGSTKFVPDDVELTVWHAAVLAPAEKQQACLIRC